MGASRWLTWSPAKAKTDSSEASVCREAGCVVKGFEGLDGNAAGVSPITTDFGDAAVSPRMPRLETELIETDAIAEPSKPSLPHLTIEEIRKRPLFGPPITPERATAVDHLGTPFECAKDYDTENVYAPPNCPPLPRGLKLVRYIPRIPPIKLDDGYSSITNVAKFIDSELRELYARLYSPVQIRGGYGVFVILDRLRQVGLEIEIVAPEGMSTRNDAS